MLTPTLFGRIVGVMTNNIRATPEVATTAGGHVRRHLASQGRDLNWLAGEIGVSVHGLLIALSERLSMGLLFDIAEVLQVRPDSLLEVEA